MIFAVVLGIMLGAAAVTLLRQWQESGPVPEVVLRPAQFPQLAPPAIVTRAGTVRRRAA